MRELYYENQGTNTYLVYAVNANDSVDSMSLGMLTNNRIHGLAQTIFTQMDSQKYIKFNVSAKVSVTHFFAGAVNKKRLLGVFTGIVNAMLAAEDYMLDQASIIMDLDYIFTDVSTCETDLICIPIIDTEAKKTDFGMFFRNIMFNTQFDQTENCDHVAKIINYLNGTPLFSLNDFKKLLEDIQEQKAQPVVTKVKTETVTSTDLSQQKKQPVASQTPSNQTSVSNQSVIGQPFEITKSPVNSVVLEMSVPPAQKQQQTTAPAVTTETTGAEISFFYLMQHYNKENAEAYKAQKAAKKRATAISKGKDSVQQPSAQKKTQTTTQPATGFGFAVPGQAAPMAQTIPQPAVQQVTPVQKSVPQTNSSQLQTGTTLAPQPAYIPRQVPQGPAANFGETTVLGGAIGETTVLTAANNPAQMIAPHLIRKKNNEKISLNKPVFRVGKERSYVDYFIGDNVAISRSHANFITREGEYFVVDTNSTNHTFVNDVMIQSNVETAISHGDTVRLANEDFEFKLY